MRIGHVDTRVSSLKRQTIRGVITAGSLGLTTMLTFPLVADATTTVPASGGNVTAQITAKDFTKCIWSSSPKLPGFGLSTNCQAVMTRVAHLSANTSTTAREFVLTVHATGPGGYRIIRMVVIEKGKAH